ncbi:DUF58 domain-containing protein [Sediminitomix flava]|uniref:Uncharacterized protein DUF58 n=1 Tax=Sediminitomix flava TaxID=379075 RepID=A0A315ZGK8_SEDFL|nr:DUF58 domain-containing protein [Sediminitomix flava]PWJ44293.1 uncharacterized protein DUF58 [Sediminitomix flava]
MSIDLNQIKEYGNIELLAKQLVEGFITGLHKSPYHGFSVEFAEHSLYNVGESTKYIDWKVFARTDRLYTKRFEEETNLRAMVLLDNSSSMYYPEKDYAKIRFSTVCAAAMAYMLQKQRDAVGLCTFSDEIDYFTQARSTVKHIHNLFLYLQHLMENVPNQKKTSVAEVIHQVAEKIHKRSMVIIFSDMMDNSSNKDELFSALQHLKHNNHEVLLFHVFDAETEINFNFKERPTIFIDVESGQEVKASPSQVKDFYKQEIQQRYHDIKMKCGQYKIDMIEVDCRQNIDQVLLPYLIKRRKMS